MGFIVVFAHVYEICLDHVPTNALPLPSSSLTRTYLFFLLSPFLIWFTFKIIFDDPVGFIRVGYRSSVRNCLQEFNPERNASCSLWWPLAARNHHGGVKPHEHLPPRYHNLPIIVLGGGCTHALFACDRILAGPVLHRSYASDHNCDKDPVI